MKLALIGTHGVGKTTLAYELCSLLKKSHHNVELVTEVARHSPFPVNAATTIEGQLWILHAQIAAELDAGRRAPHLIADRSVLDNYCYLVNKFGRQPQLEPWLAWWMNTYDVLVGVPPVAVEIPADGFRSEDRAFQLRIHELLLQLLSSEPFNQVRAPVLWLKAEDRDRWAEKLFASVAPNLTTNIFDSLADRNATNIPPISLQAALKRSLESGSLRRDDDLDVLDDKLADCDCDYLDVVEVAMELERRTGRDPKTVGDLLDLLESDGSDDASSPVARK